MAVVEKIYLIENKHRHNGVKNEYLHVKNITGGSINFKVLYCDICKKYICSRIRYENEYKNKIDSKIFAIPNKDTFIKDTSIKIESLNNILLNDISSFKKEHAEHNICERSLKYKGENFELSYCKDCDSYGTETIYYHNIINNRKLDDDYTILEGDYEEYLKHFDNVIEFLIRINTFRCNVRKHNIEEIIAVVNVFNKKNNSMEEVEVNAFYCRNCNLYYIYENEYTLLLKKGIPICPIHEELKYFNKSNNFDSYNTESILRQFGYNVNAQENLSANERHKIIEIILNNGIMSKNEIISHLNFLTNSRKNQANMFNAISKWNDDIKFVHTIKTENRRVVKIGAIRKFKKIEKM